MQREKKREAPAVWSDDYFKIPIGETKYSDTLLNPWEKTLSGHSYELMPQRGFILYSPDFMNELALLY